jgi:RAB protein geranylgeranyltransferase component A
MEQHTMNSNILQIETVSATKAIHILSREIDTELLSLNDKRRLNKVINLLWKYEEREERGQK